MSRDAGMVTYAARDAARWLRAGPMRAWRRRHTRMVARRPDAGGESQWGWGARGGDSYAGGISCKQRCRRVMLLGVLLTRRRRDCEQAGFVRALVGAEIGSSAATQDSDSADGTRGRYSFFRGHCAFLLRRHGGALTTQRETTTPRPAGGIQSHKNFSPSRVNRPSASEDHADCEPDFDCKDCNKYFLNSDKEEVPRQVSGSPRRGQSWKERRQIQLLHQGRRLLRIWHRTTTPRQRSDLFEP